MALPKYVKITRNGVEYIDGTDRAKYCIAELTRAAMIAVGSYILNKFRGSVYRGFLRKKTGNSRYALQYWVPKKDDDGKTAQNAVLYVGYKAPRKAKRPAGFHAVFRDEGTKFIEGRNLLYSIVSDNLEEIRKIEAQYLSAINDADDGESRINESEAESDE